MNSLRVFLKRPMASLGAALVLYAGLALAFTGASQYRINPDGVSYISIAQHYLQGHFGEAINGYWGPLYSWLLVPLLATGLEPLLAARILNVLLGAVVLWLFWLLARRYAPKPVELLWLPMVVSAILVAHWALVGPITSDLSFLAALLGYLYFASQDTPKSWRQSVAMAGFGFLAFLSKSYAFPFILAHFTLTHAWRYWEVRRLPERKLWMKRGLIGLGVFVALCSMWIGLISHKYHKLTFGTSSSYNWSIGGPYWKDHPMHSEILAPPNADAVSTWEDPSYIPILRWSPLRYPGRVWWLIETNTQALEGTLQQESFLAMAILFAALLVYGWPVSGRVSGPGKVSLFWVFTCLLFVSGYVVTLIEERYVWLLVLLLLLLATQLLQRLSDRDDVSRWPIALAAVIVGASFVGAPAAELASMSGGYPADVTYKDEAAAIAAQVNLQGKNVASSQPWDVDMYLAYYLHAHYYGVSDAMDAGATASAFKANHIGYYIYQGDATKVPAFLAGYQKVADLPMIPLAVYKISP